MKKRCILSTCGTSLLTNGTDADLRGLIIRHANIAQPDILEPDIRQRLITHCHQRREQILATQDLSELQRLSAELNGIIRLYQAGFEQSTADHHLLICTDTWLGEETAQIVDHWLQTKGLSTEIWRITDLQTAELERFRLGMAELVKRCAEVLPGYQAQGYQVIFNLTGGFKSVQGFLQTLGMFYADESVYTFESGQDLLRLPRLPLQLDADYMVRSYLDAFRRTGVGLSLTGEVTQNLPDTLFMTIDHEATLSPWGELIWQQSRKKIQGEQLLEPISLKLRYGSNFAKTVVDLNADRLTLVNQRLDELARYLETGVNLHSLDFKEIKGHSKAPSTHECDAWHDQDARRLFGHYDGNVFVVDALARGLH